jgi:acetyl-CoA carboxylase biotin carboxylase subunit
VDDAGRQRLGEAAVKACRAMGYRNAGTVEFLADGEGGFWFMEVNARLQVEHPVTEEVTGIDLVRAQFAIAAGEPLPFQQQDVRLRGSSIECRLYAEDPENGFLPSPGRIERLRVPGGPGVRDDSGIYEGYTMPIHYDALLSKLITWGASRLEAIERMERALGEYIIEGIPTTIPFHRRVMKDPRFREGSLHTRFIEGMNGRPAGAGRIPDPLEDLAAIAIALSQSSPSPARTRARAAATSAWKLAGRRRAMDDRS